MRGDSLHGQPSFVDAITGTPHPDPLPSEGRGRNIYELFSHFLSEVRNSCADQGDLASRNENTLRARQRSKGVKWFYRYWIKLSRNEPRQHPSR